MILMISPESSPDAGARVPIPDWDHGAARWTPLNPDHRPG